MSKSPAIIRDMNDAFNPRASLDVVLASKNIEQTVADVIRQITDQEFMHFHDALVEANWTRRKRLLQIASRHLGVFSKIANCLRYTCMLRLHVPEHLHQYEGNLEKLERVAAQCRQKFRELVNEALAQIPPGGRM